MSLTPAQKLAWYQDNRERLSLEQKAKYAANPGYYKIKNLRRYGVTPVWFLAQHHFQGGKCAICRSEHAPGRSLDVDHNHKTGKARELLCHLCNRMLGLVKENPVILQTAQQYLERH